MKKILLTILSVSLLILCLFSLVSCKESVGEVKNLKLDSDTLTLSWDRVLGAKSYTVVISDYGVEKTSKQNTYSLEFLDAGTYEIQIKANGDGTETKDSDWTTYTFVREAETGLRYKLINNKTEYEVIGLGTASGDVVMTDTYRGKPVTSIADKAFSGNNRLTSFTVGKNVKTIGANAFSRCAELTSITIPESVTKIGDHCFQSCKKLESFTFPNSIVNVEPYIFSWCSALKTVTFGNQTETIGDYAFSNCESLEKAILPDTVTFIGEYTFSDCESLTEAYLGNSLKTINAYAFYNCIVMTDLNLGTSLETIGEGAFGNCDGIVSIVIPDSCHSIYNAAFRYCDNLESVRFGSSLSYLGAIVFNNTKFYNNVERDVIVDGWYVACKDKKITEIKLPANVYAIADSAFFGCKELTKIEFTGIKYVCNSAFWGCSAMANATFDDALLSIGDYAFKECSALVRIKIGESVQSIGDYAFSKCTRLQSANINIPATITSIGIGAFNNTNVTVENNIMYVGKWAVGYSVAPNAPLGKIKIKEGTIGIANYAFSGAPLLQENMNEPGIYIPNSMVYIGRGAFYNAAALGYAVTVRLPEGENSKLTYIGDYAFYGCYCAFFGTNQHLVIPEGTEYIGRSAFYGCSSIYSLSIPGSVKSIGAYAFYKCISIGATLPSEKEDEPGIPGSFTMLDGIESIGEKAFYGCTGLEVVYIPDSVTSIGSRAFYKCTAIKTLVLGNGLTSIPDYAFYNCSALENLIIPDSVTNIGAYAFRGCNALKALHLGSSVTSIGKFAFMGAENLQTLVIPKSVTSIGMHAFRGMTRVKSVSIPATVQTIEGHAFYGAAIAVIYVDSDKIPESWNVRWNSSYAVVITDCVLSADRDYLISFKVGVSNPDYLYTGEKLTLPVRDSYTCIGFSTTPGGEVVYTAETVIDAPVGTTLYTVWQAKNTTNNDTTTE